jgi:hypothetical protein
LRAIRARILAITVLLLAFGVLAYAMLSGGDVTMIPFSLILAAGSMALFRKANLEKDR